MLRLTGIVSEDAKKIKKIGCWLTMCTGILLTLFLCLSFLCLKKSEKLFLRDQQLKTLNSIQKLQAVWSAGESTTISSPKLQFSPMFLTTHLESFVRATSDNSPFALSQKCSVQFIRIACRKFTIVDRSIFCLCYSLNISPTSLSSQIST